MKTLTLRHLAGLSAASAIALVPVAALAHGKLETAAPALGSTVDVAPNTLRLAFNEDIEPNFSSVKVSDANGAQVTKEKARVDASNPRVMTLAVPKLTSGAYTVQWAVMTADAHKTKGTYTFKVK
ncbi:copper resistance protein CopC [Trinickia dabaoshanensis]|uniref:Copper resistance protein CopC n=1 Tax=Trinickia dabaoshanensis TaxID=564714 RepID=A0A2N7VRC0_9BURK|nr:copper homeostasis periplasmic binding protein CopC [Trinickia dabaoshanensis]PMS19699.1 copper resistance protein CopC [Trinickia dabaoshanensis]TAM50916.1 MAG: copper resistance protein CopC [Paraburkholderia sp.]